MHAQSKKLIFFSGLGADARLFSKLEIPGYKIETPAFPIPSSKDSLPSYAARLAQISGIDENSLIGGFSFGGMCAAQIAATRKVKALILMASCFHPGALPKIVVVLAKLWKWLPHSLLNKIRTHRRLLQKYNGPLAEDELRILQKMMWDTPEAMHQEGNRMIIEWEGVQKPSCPSLVIHGDRDALISYKIVKPDLLLPGAAHPFPLARAQETSQAIASFLKTIDNAG